MTSDITAAPVDPWRWWYRLYAVWIAAVHFVVGGMLVFGPARWEQSNSLQAIHDATRIPWVVWGVVFWLLGVGILIGGSYCVGPWRLNPRKASYLVSAGISGVFEVASIVWTVLPGKTTNPIVIFFSTLSILAMISGARYCELQEADRVVEDITSFDYRKHMP